MTILFAVYRFFMEVIYGREKKLTKESFFYDVKNHIWHSIRCTYENIVLHTQLLLAQSEQFFFLLNFSFKSILNVFFIRQSVPHHVHINHVTENFFLMSPYIFVDFPDNRPNKMHICVVGRLKKTSYQNEFHYNGEKQI